LKQKSWKSCAHSASTTNGKTQLLRQTLLDQYAMAAFNARMQKHHDWTLTDIAEQSWRDANALMKARNAKP
jgi:hypothetical protein